MANGKTPFIKKKVTCPICNSESENRFFMPKSFMEKTVESDKHVAEYSWIDKEFQHIHPPFYHFWNCRTCNFTATQRDFLKPGEDSGSNYNDIKKAMLAINPSQKQILQMLTLGLDFDKMDFPMAVKLHLAAIFIQEMVPGDVRDTSKIGSYYLRTAWLIREKVVTEDPDGLWAQTQTFLVKMAKLWNSSPKSEEECLKIAAKYYEQAYASHPRYANIISATDLMILIADIYMRSGDQAQSMKALTNVMQVGQKFRTQQGELLRKEKEAGTLNVSRKAQIDAQSAKVNVLMERAGDMRQELIKLKIAEQEPKAKAVLAKLQAAGMDTEAIREKLKELKFEPALILKLLGEPKKKKFLGLF